MKLRFVAVLNNLFQRPLYKFFLVLLGLPTFLVAALVYIPRARHFRIQATRRKKNAWKELTDSGRLEKIKNECEDSLRRKYGFFGKPCGTRRYRLELKRQAQKAVDEAVQSLCKRIEERGDGGNSETFIRFLSSKLTDSSLLFLVSLVSSLPMYVLLLLCFNPIVRYSLERVFFMVFVILGVVFLVFTIMHFSAFDPALSILGNTATEEELNFFRETYGLNDSYFQQLWSWIKRIVSFDLGNSYTGNEDVLDSLMRKFPATLRVALMAICFGMIISLPLGILSSLRPYSGLDYFAVFLALILMSVPEFWLGMLMTLNFSIKQHLLPAKFDINNIKTYIMPAIAMSCTLLASVTRMTRSSMLEVKKQEYVLTARAKGLSYRYVVMRHMFPNALIPVITMAGVGFGQILGGSAITEKVFTIPGIGNYIISKIFVPDVPVVLSGVVYVAIVISLLNLAIDILYAIVDPRIRANLKNR